MRVYSTSRARALLTRTDEEHMSIRCDIVYVPAKENCIERCDAASMTCTQDEDCDVARDPFLGDLIPHRATTIFS